MNEHVSCLARFQHGVLRVVSLTGISLMFEPLALCVEDLIAARAGRAIGMFVGFVLFQRCSILERLLAWPTENTL